LNHGSLRIEAEIAARGSKRVTTEQATDLITVHRADVVAAVEPPCGIGTRDTGGAFEVPSFARSSRLYGWSCLIDSHGIADLERGTITLYSLLIIRS
jgi:hypothetical protein